MASPIDICNVALRMLRAATITDFSDNTNEARIASMLYEPTRDALLAEEPWRFAMTRASLAKTTSTPIDLDDFDNEFQLPPDFMVMRRVNDRLDDYTIEGDKLLANEDVVNILYTYKVTDATKYHPQFIKALALKLASIFAYPISGSKELTTIFDDLAEKQIAKARFTDAIQAPARTSDEDTDLYEDR